MEEFIPISEPYIARNQLSYVNDCIKTNWISSLGKYISVFEEKFSKFDAHPNELGHGIAARAIYENLKKSNILSNRK